ncbi:MAG: NAD-binding protein [Solirubrobacteraceae bacterium]
MTTLAAEPAGRRPLTPGTPAPLLGWVRGSSTARRLPLPVWPRVAITVAATLILGTWGYLELGLPRRLNLLESLYAAVKLYTLDLGPANGGVARPDWQIWLALAAAAGLVLRGVLALARDRVRRASVGHLLSGHVVICGAGVHGTRLARTLSHRHDVVLIDLDTVSPGMQELRGRYEWRLIGDAVSARTLRAAGVPRAHWLIAVTGNDFVNSQIVSAVRSLGGAGQARDNIHVLVQIEDPGLARFLEEDEGSAPSDQDGPHPVVSPFSANAIAAEALLDESQVRRGDEPLRPLLAMRNGTAPNLLLVGDHPVIDALVLAALRRWRVRQLRELEGGTGVIRPSIHISVYGPGAERRVARLHETWRPEPEVLTLEGRDSPPPGEVGIELDDWLREPDRGDHAIVACADELDGIALTLAAARALGAKTRMTRVTTQFENELDAYVEERTARSPALATTEVKSIADLGARPERMAERPGVQRLIEALERDRELRHGGVPKAGAEAGAGAGADRSDPVARARAVFARPEIKVRSGTTWRIRPAERRLLDALLDLGAELEAVPVSAIMRAGLQIDLDSAPGRLLAARRLTERGDPAALTAWCEYLRLVPAGGGAAGEQTVADPAVARLIALAAAVSGDRRALLTLPPEGTALAGASRVAIFAGAAGSMTALTSRELEPLLEAALAGYDGAILSGGTAVGMPGLVGRIAQRHELRLLGYAPAGRGDHQLYDTVRETPDATDFSVLEPLAMWTDILRAGLSPGDVALVACPGGPITLQEVVLGRALGARVGWLDPAAESPRALDELLPFGAAGVLELPPDAMTLRAFLAPTRLSEPPREAVARYLHNDYRRRQRQRKSSGDPALAPWAELPPSLRSSNLAQADDIPNKLSLIGKRLAPDGEHLDLSSEQVELLAEVEHGRWNAERLAAGWRVGPRQVGRSTSPDLIPWSQLPDDVREYDREAVRNIAPALADAGWGVTDG